MINSSLREQLAVAIRPAMEWGERRLQERSTWIGIAGWLCTIGFAGFGARISSHLDLIVAIAGILNTGLITTSTKPRSPELVLVPTLRAIEATLAPASELVIPPGPTGMPLADTPSPIVAPPPRPVPLVPTPTEGNDMSLITAARKLFGIIAVAVAPTWSKAIANSLAQSEAVLVPLLGDDAKKLCEDAVATDASGFTKLGNVVHDLYNIAVTKGIKADYLVLTVIAAKAYAQIAENAPALIDTAIETGISATAGPAVAALTAPVVEVGVAAATHGLTPATA